MYTTQSRSILLALALFNFLFLWYSATNHFGICYLCPWYVPWSFTNEPTLILISALALRLGWIFGYGIAMVLSGYVFVVGANLLFFQMSLIEKWSYWRFHIQEIFLQIEVQFILASIVVGFAVYNLIREIWPKNT